MNALITYEEKRAYHNRRKQLLRQRQLRRNLLIFFFTILIAIILAFTLHTFNSNANTDLDDISYKYFTTLEISQNDTLWSIAVDNIDYNYYKDINSYIKEVIQINHLKTDTITAGCSLIIPYYSNNFIQ